MRTTALLIDDDARLAALVREYLGGHEIDVTVAGDGERGLAALRRQRVDVVLLDVMLPGADGLEICRRIRATPELAAVPIVMLTARGDDVDRIVGLELGADDYLPKPFNPRELLARVRAVLRRGRATAAPGRRFRTGRLEIDFDAREVTVGGKRQPLTSYEFDLLAVLARAAGRVLSREQLLDALKGAAYDAFDRSIDVHISKLRAKLEANPKEPRYIKTVRGAGYLLPRDGDWRGAPALAHLPALPRRAARGRAHHVGRGGGRHARRLPA
jgi:DNA-binding response OmpR family regulator